MLRTSRPLGPCYAGAAPNMSVLEKALQSVARIKLSGGVVGRVCQVVMVVSVCFVVLGAWSGNANIMGGGIVAVFLFAFPLLWKAISFAEKNPYAALLDGSELLLHQRMILGTKTQPTLPPASEMTLIEEGDLPVAAAEGLSVNDAPPVAELEERGSGGVDQGEE